MTRILKELLEFLGEDVPLPDELRERLSDSMFNKPNREAFVAVINYLFSVTGLGGAASYPICHDVTTHMKFLSNVSSVVSQINEEYSHIHKIDPVQISVLKTSSGKKFICWLTQFITFILKFTCMNKYGVPKEVYIPVENETSYHAQMAEILADDDIDLDGLKKESEELRGKISNIEKEILDLDDTIKLEIERDPMFSTSNATDYEQLLKEKGDELQQEMSQSVDGFFSEFKQKSLDLADACCKLNLASILSNEEITQWNEELDDIIKNKGIDGLVELNMLLDTIKTKLKKVIYVDDNFKKIYRAFEKLNDNLKNLALPEEKGADEAVASLFASKFPFVEDFKIAPIRMVSVDIDRNLDDAEMKCDLKAIEEKHRYTRTLEEDLLAAYEDDNTPSRRRTSSDHSTKKSKCRRVTDLPEFKALKEKWNQPSDAQCSVEFNDGHMYKPIMPITEVKQFRRQTIDSPVSLSCRRGRFKTQHSNRRMSCRKLDMPALDKSPSLEDLSSISGIDSGFSFDDENNVGSVFSCSKSLKECSAFMSDQESLEIDNLISGDKGADDSFIVELPNPAVIERRPSLNTIKNKLAKIRGDKSTASADKTNENLAESWSTLASDRESFECSNLMSDLQVHNDSFDLELPHPEDVNRRPSLNTIKNKLAQIRGEKSEK